MRLPSRCAVGLCALLVASLAAPLRAQDAAVAAAEDGARVIVKLKHDSPVLAGDSPAAGGERERRARELGRRLGMAMRSGAALSERAQGVIVPGMTSDALARRLRQEGDVEYAVPDRRRRAFVAPSDPLYGDGLGGNGPAAGQWYLRAPSGSVASSINAEAAWAITTGSPSIVVAVLDTGVRYEHPDLLSVAAGGNLLPGYDMISDLPTANDGNGRDADASDPGDWLTQQEVSLPSSALYQCQPSPSASSWHGTMTSALIAARTDNGLGMASVGRNVRVLPVRVLGKCGGYDSDIIAGMRWAAGLSVPGVPANTNRAQVINMSLGGDGPCDSPYPETIAEVNAAGTTVVVAAGNSSGHAVSAPANCPGAIAVAGLRQIGTKVGYSDLGPEIAISAPAGNCVNAASGSPCLYPILTATNTGSTVPATSTYTTAYSPSVGTSFSAPLVAGTIALMLSAQPTLTPAHIRQALQSSATAFPRTGSEDATVVQCTAPQYDRRGNPLDQGECYCTTSTCGAGMLNTGAAVAAVQTNVPSSAWVPAEGLWWNAPAGSESGWGINLAQQGNTIFATWFTYDATGKASWLTMTADKLANGSFTGTLYQTSGPSFDSMPFDPNLVTRTPVGFGTLTFSDSDTGSFTYIVNGIAQTKSITRQTFASPPHCVWGAMQDLSLATNYQDLWWASPPGSESGWGVNFTHQGDTIFATWFTYDTDGTPLWLSATATKSAPGVYGGALYRTTGPAFSAGLFDSAQVTRTPVGTLTLSFANGNSATYAYTVALAGAASTVRQTKSIARQVFVAPGTDCQ